MGTALRTVGCSSPSRQDPPKRNQVLPHILRGRAGGSYMVENLCHKWKTAIFF